MSDTPRFDLLDIVGTLRRRAGFVLLITLLAAIVGAMAYFFRKKQYKAVSEFFVSNPHYTDRNNLFRTDQAQFISYFGTEDDIDKVMAIAKSDVLRDRVIRRANLAAVYRLDTTKKEDGNKLEMMFKGRYEVKRTEFQDMAVSYTDSSADLAAAVTRAAVAEIADMYSGYYSSLRTHVYNSLNEKIAETDSALTSIAGAADAATSNVDRMKLSAATEQMIRDRSKYISLLGEFSTGTKVGELPLINVITEAEPPKKPTGLGGLLTIVAATLVGFMFAVLWVLLTGYYKALTAAERAR